MRKRPTALRRDPQLTGGILRKWEADIKSRFARLQAALLDFMVVRDVLGLKEEPVTNDNFSFDTDPQKLESFNDWLKEQVAQDIFRVPGAFQSRPWLSPYVDSAYRQGIASAWIASNAIDLAPGGMDQFLGAFAGPVSMDSVKLIYSQAYTDLEGITAAMSAQISRILARGLVDGSGPLALAKKMNQTVKGIGLKRALTMARTELSRAHAEGQLDSFEKLGIQQLGLRAEWLTAGDDRVCPECEDNAGQTYTIDEARGLIPLHPGCRCSWIPLIPKKLLTSKA